MTWVFALAPACETGDSVPEQCTCAPSFRRMPDSAISAESRSSSTRWLSRSQFPRVRTEVVAPPPVPDVGFGNPQAVRIGLLVALLAFFVAVISVQFVSQTLPVLPIVSLLGGGSSPCSCTGGGPARFCHCAAVRGWVG